MYMIAGLCMLKLYQKRHPDINASAYTAYACLAMVIFFSVLGVVSGSARSGVPEAACGGNSSRSLVSVLWFAGVWEGQPGVLDRFLRDPHPGHPPAQHAALLHGPMEAG